MDEQAMREVVRTAVRDAGSQREFARRVGVSVPFINDVLHGRRNVGPTISAYLGYCVTVEYVRKANYTKDRQP